MKIANKANLIVAAAAVLALSGTVARASSEITSTTTTSTFINNATVGAGPGIVVTSTSGDQLLVPSIRNANPVMFVTTGAQITGFNIYLPNDLLTRRDDLIARIYAEKAMGKLSDTQASALLAEVQTVAHRSCGSTTDCGSGHAKQVQSIYRDFDKVSNDIFSNSHQGNKQLAGQYSFIVL